MTDTHRATTCTRINNAPALEEADIEKYVTLQKQEFVTINKNFKLKKCTNVILAVEKSQMNFRNI